MPDSGFNPLAVLAPDLYAQQLAIQRRQALAQSLLQQGEGNSGSAAYGGLANAGKSLLGAFLAKRGDQAMANLYSPQPDASQATSLAPSEAPGQVSNASMPSASQDATPPSGVPQGQSPQIGNTPGPQPIQQQAPNVAMGQALQGKRSIPSVMNGAIADLPGLSHQQSMLAYFQSPQAYYTALAAANAPTPEQKNASFAMPGDVEGQRNTVSATLAKSGAIPVTRGMVNIPDGHGGYRQQYAPPPAPAGYQYVSGQNGQPILIPLEGGQSAVAGSAYAQQAPKALLTPTTGYSQQSQPDGTMAYMPQASNALAMSGNGGAAGQLGIGPQSQQPLGLRTNNPGNLQPGGQQATYGTPAEGILRASANLDNYAKQGINTLSGIISRWAPSQGGNDTASYIADVSKRLGVDPNQPLNLQDHRVKGTVLDAIFTHENGPKTMTQAGAPILPELPPGIAAGSQRMANNAADQATGQSSDWGQTHAMAADVPTRLNVLQSIMKLSQAGAPTGSTEWMNEARDTAAALSQALGHPISANNPAALMGEIQKYMAQQANRMAQGQGGTGSDKQLEAVQHANPNSEMFASTLQRVVPWIMANERGIAAKANFLDAQPGAMNDAKSQLAAQNAWRNIYSPRVAQFEMMNPQQQAGYLNDPHAFRDKADRQQFIQSAMKLHPYFAQGH